jgi:predicted metalloprotease
MRWRRLRRREGGVVDRRGRSFGGIGGAGIPLPVGGGIGAVLLVVAFIAFQMCTGSAAIPTDSLDDLGSAGGGATGSSEIDPEDELAQFVDAVFDDVQITWDEDIFGPSGRRYEFTELVRFSGATQSGCGAASSATGPFYCPLDRLVYFDFGFFRELARRFGAPGDFAQAYVIAHEVAHHVQTLLGTNAAVQQESRENPDSANDLYVRLELQADCFAGVWGYSVAQRGILEQGDLEEGLTAAAAVGDDRIQQQTQGRIDPETFTHGTSEQRVEWFRRGFESGDPADCDTFGGDV